MLKNQKAITIILVIVIVVSALLPVIFFLTYQNVPGKVVSANKYHNHRNQVVTVSYTVNGQQYTLKRNYDIHYNIAVGDEITVSANPLIPYFTFTWNDAWLYYVVAAIGAAALFAQRKILSKKGVNNE